MTLDQHWSRFGWLTAALLVSGGTASPVVGGSLFNDATFAAGLAWNQITWGAQAVDMDRDGDLDLFSGHHFSSAYVHTNLGNGTFTVWGLPQIVTFGADRHGVFWGHLDDDEWLDVCCQHGGEGGCGCDSDPSELWRGTGPGFFSPVTIGGAFADSAGRGRSVSAADIDGDGDLDLHVGKAPLAASPNSLYRNDGNLSFVDVAPAWGVAEVLGTVGSIFGDIDNDGDPDLLVGGEEFDRPTKLFRNDGSQFRDVTASYLPGIPVIAGADFGDYDGDEDLDLIVCEGSDAVYDVARISGNKVIIFANHRFGDNGDDAFTCSTSGGNPTAYFRQNGEVHNDLVFLGPNAVNPASGAGVVTLTDAYVGAPSYTPGVSKGIYCWRTSPGGPWEVRVTSPPGTYGNYTAEINSIGAPSNLSWSMLEQPALSPGRPRLYRNQGGTFFEVTAAAGLTASQNPRQVTFVDVDNDGDLDIHLVNKGSLEIGNEIDRLWIQSNGAFTADDDEVPGVSAHLSDGGAWGDFDRDGDLDLFLQEGAGPLYFSLSAPSIYYRNDGAPGSSLVMRLLGGAGATSAGAKATAYVGSLVVHRRVRADSWRSFQHSEDLHFGLGGAVAVDSLVVEWPSGNREKFVGLPAGGWFEIREGGATDAPPRLETGQVTEIGRVAPQPGRATQSFSLVLPRGGPMQIDVFDLQGRRIRQLFAGTLSPGTHRMDWDGRDQSNRIAPAGVYWIRGAGVVGFERKAVRLR